MKAKRFVSAILCMVIVMGMLPITSHAFTTQEKTIEHLYVIRDKKGEGGNRWALPCTDYNVGHEDGEVKVSDKQKIKAEFDGSAYIVGFTDNWCAMPLPGNYVDAYGTKWDGVQHAAPWTGEGDDYKLYFKGNEDGFVNMYTGYVSDCLDLVYDEWGKETGSDLPSAEPVKRELRIYFACSWNERSAIGALHNTWEEWTGKTAIPCTEVSQVNEAVLKWVKGKIGTVDDTEFNHNPMLAVASSGDKKLATFMYVIGLVDKPWAEVVSAVQSKEEQEESARKALLDALGAETIDVNDYMGKIRYLALTIDDEKLNEAGNVDTLKEKVFGSPDVVGSLNETIWAIYELMRDNDSATWKDVEAKVPSGKRSETLICAWYCYVYFSGSKVYNTSGDVYTADNQLLFNSEDANRYLPDKVSRNMSVLAAAYDYLKQNVGDDIIYTDVSGVQAALTWGVRMKAAVGLANGLFEPEPDSQDKKDDYMSVIELLGLGSFSTQIPSARTPSTWVAQPRSTEYVSDDEPLMFYYATSPGLTATILMSAELGQISYYMTNVFSVFVKDGSKNFAGRSREIDALRQLYEDMVFFDDPDLWELWNTTAFDTTTEEPTEKLSLNDVYEYLRANNAFNILNSSDVEEGKPFAYFFNNEALTGHMITGIKESARFIPMRTNVYDPYTWRGNVDTEWLVNFYAKFGYMRKVLYIDTNQDAASNYVNTGGRGNLEVATLQDLLQDKDIVLYLGDNLYNVDQIADMVGKAWDRLGNSDDTNQNSLGAFDTFTKAITGLWEVSMEEIAKSGSNVAYSSRVPDYQVSQSTGKATSKKWRDKYENFFLPIQADEAAETDTVSDDETVYQNVDSIAKYLYPDDLLADDGESLKPDSAQVTYSPMLGFAVLSGIYRDPGTKKDVNSALSSNTPVFVSSPTSPYLSESRSREIYNYLLCRNLEAVMPVDYSVSLDMTSPLYMDIFGNILTESGTVVIPAAANATLWKQGSWHAYNAAFLYTYGKGFTYDYSDNDNAKAVNAQLEVLLSPPEGREGKWTLASLKTVDGTIDMSRLSIADRDSLDAIVNTFAYELTNNVESFMASSRMWKMIITEVLRGAPIEDIDKQFEDIQTNTTYTRQGLIVADKLENLVDAIAPAGQNASIAIPNPAYIEGIEVIVFFIYKLLILAILVVWMINIYLDATGGGIGLRTAGKCVGVVVLVIAMIVGIPKTFELTYYESNKRLLQEETEYLLMLNLEKQANGEEIGVSRVDVPESNTKLYLRLADVEIPWWNLLSSITVSAGYNSLDTMYQEYENRHPLAYTDQAVTKNGGIYIDTDTLFESAKITFSPYMQVMYVTGATDTPASYYTPYYYFLDTIVDEVSRWSKTQNYIAYTTKIQRGGELKTMGYATAFFESEDFIAEGADLFGLYRLYDQTAPTVYPYLPAVSDGDLDLLRESQWCNMSLGQKGVQSRIEKLNIYAQKWIANNRGMLGRVSDETFLKCFALSCAMEHNRLFNTQRADYLEIQELSNEDLLRLSIAPHNEVMANSSMSYARFVYTTGGTMAVYVAAVLEIVNFISSWVKPACTLAVFLIACASIFILKLILRRGNNSLYGYIITIALMCSVNVLGALFTKVSMYIPNLGFTPTVCMLVQILVQILYIFLQLKIVSVALKDWRNSGYQQYESTYNRMRIFNGGMRNISRDVATKREPSGWNYYDNLTATLPKRRLKA